MKLRFLFAAFLALLLSGCACNRWTALTRPAPPFRPSNFTGDVQLPAELRRVILLPVCGDTFAPPETAATLDALAATALQKCARFEIVQLTRRESRRMFGSTEFRSTSALPPGFFERIASEFGADAVLFIDLTAYQPYRPLAIGLRAKLATSDGSRLVWAFDEVFSGDSPEVAEAARAHFLRVPHDCLPVDLSPAALESPSRFGAFSFDTMFATLPPR